MTIDSLTHVTPDGRWFNTIHDASLDRLMHEMDKANVETSVVVALAGYISNKFVFETCAKSQGRLIPGASINPAGYEFPEQAADAARRLLGSGDFPVLKLHPRLNGYDPLDPRCLAVLETVNAMTGSVRVWLDSIFRNGRCLLHKSPVDTVHALIQQFSQTPFVLLHGGGPLLLQMAELLTEHDNLTLDISLTLNYYHRTSINQDIDFLLEKREKRICAGSDFPEYTQTQYLDLLEAKARHLEISQKDMQKIQGRNLAQILDDRSMA